MVLNFLPFLNDIDICIGLTDSSFKIIRSIIKLDRGQFDLD